MRLTTELRESGRDGSSGGFAIDPDADVVEVVGVVDVVEVVPPLAGSAGKAEPIHKRGS